MDMGRWKKGDTISVLDLVAHFDFKTPSSLSFQLVKTVDRHSPRLPEMWAEGEHMWDLLLESGGVSLAIGWLDIHYPCDGAHSLRLRVGLPDRYVSCESMRDLVPQVIAAIELPPDVPYRVDLAGLSQQASTMEPMLEWVTSSCRGHQEARPAAADETSEDTSHKQG